MTRKEIIAMAEQSGMKASIGKTVKEKGKADVYHPDVNALGKSVPVEWLERFAILVEQKKLASLAADVTEPESIGYRMRFRSEAGMIGNYPWSYFDEPRRTAVKGVQRPDFEYNHLFTADQLRDYGDRRAAAERARAVQKCAAIAAVILETAAERDISDSQRVVIDGLADIARTCAEAITADDQVTGRNQLGGV